VSVILNRYSSTMPVLMIAGICAIPIVLLLFVAWRHEKQHGWIKEKFLRHSVSYSLLGLIFLPFFLYSTEILYLRLKEVLIPSSRATTQTAPPTAKPEPAPASQNTPPPLSKLQVPIATPKHPKKNDKSTASPPSLTPAPNPAPPVQQIPQQTMTNSPGGMQAGHDLTVFGPLPPPARVLNPDDVKEAVGLLKQVKDGSIFFITYPTQVPDHGEISSFTDKLEDVFSEAGWMTYRERNNYLGFSTVGGGGIGCSTPQKMTPASELAIKALLILHYPCTHPSIFSDVDIGGPSNYALFVTVGTR